jgi:predicted TIM-barrel fold metal-dependent hydrolase
LPWACPDDAAKEVGRIKGLGFVAAMLYSHSGPLLVDDQKMAREYLGADRLMFGADYPFVDQDVLLDILQKSNYSDAELDGIFWKNAERLFGPLL